MTKTGILHSIMQNFLNLKLNSTLNETGFSKITRCKKNVFEKNKPEVGWVEAFIGDLKLSTR